MAVGNWVVLDSAEKQVGGTHVAIGTVVSIGNFTGAFTESCCCSRNLPVFDWCEAIQTVSVVMLDKHPHPEHL